MPKKPPPSAGALLAALRWAKATEKDRQQSRENGKLGGRPPSAERCPCGRYSKHTAALRAHKCEKGK